LHLGNNVKEYIERGHEMIEEYIKAGGIRCDICTEPMKRHSSYVRGIKETGEKLTIIIVRCGDCMRGRALLPDFILANKHFSANEIEAVIIENAEKPVGQIDTAASEPTVRRWIRQIGEGVERAVSVVKSLFAEMGQAISEIAINAVSGYAELEQVLEMAPEQVKYSGNKLGLANLWLGRFNRESYI